MSLINGKGTDVAVDEGTSLLWEITCRMGSCRVSRHLAAVTFLPLPQQMLVFNLATSEGCKTELSWMVITSQDNLPAKDNNNNNNNNQICKAPECQKTSVALADRNSRAN